MKPQVMARDVERLARDLTADLLEDAGESCTVGIAVPDDWTDASPPHLSVVSDGEPVNAWPSFTYATIRFTARAASTTEAKRLCRKAHGLFLSYGGDDIIASTRYLTGVLPAIDPDTGTPLASATARMACRTEPIESGS